MLLVGIYSCYSILLLRLVTGTHFETAIQNMMEMGFPREQCMNAMRASFNNPDRAVEYLMTVCDIIHRIPLPFLSCYFDSGDSCNSSRMLTIRFFFICAFCRVSLIISRLTQAHPPPPLLVPPLPLPALLLPPTPLLPLPLPLPALLPLLPVLLSPKTFSLPLLRLQPVLVVLLRLEEQQEMAPIALPSSGTSLSSSRFARWSSKIPNCCSRSWFSSARPTPICCR